MKLLKAVILSPKMMINLVAKTTMEPKDNVPSMITWITMSFIWMFQPILRLLLKPLSASMVLKSLIIVD